MNTEKYINKEQAIAVAIVATISILFVAPSALSSPVFALGHWHEGDNMESSDEDEVNTDVNALNSESQVNQKELVSCLADTQEGSSPTQDEIKDCLNTVDDSEEDAEEEGRSSDNDAISVSDDDHENSNAPLNSIDKGSIGAPQSNENEEEAEE